MLVSRSARPTIDRSDESGAHAAQRLESARVIWLTTVDRGGTPQTSPVWFLWEGDEFSIYSLDSPRVRNVNRHPEVSLNLDGNGMGGDIVVVEGQARIDHSAPSAAENVDYLAKYGPVMDDRGWSPEWFAGRYSVPIRITATKYRYW